MKFLRNLLAAIFGCLIAFGVLFLMFILFAALVGSADDGISVKKNSILELQLQFPIKDYVGNDSSDPFSSFMEKSFGLNEILHAIEVAKDDDKIKGISLNNNVLMSGMAQTKAIRDALLDFQESGKFVYAYGDMYTQKDYYLASVADSIFLNNVGSLDFKGLSAEVLFYKELQEKTGVKMEVIRHGKYKSAVEPFLADEMSDANREQISELINSLWNSMLDEISEGRNISTEELNSIADDLEGRSPKLAKASGLIDGALFYDQYEGKLKEAADIAYEDDMNYIGIEDYIQVAAKKKLHIGSDKIAVIYAQGEIGYGEGGPDVIAQGIMNKALIKAREDKSVKAIVLRINSPGGSALTSDLIWREVILTKEVKPVIVSMGNVAASGGYYIAAGADKIFAEPTTITGSIGVFGVVPNLSELASDIGINAEQVGTNKNSVDYSLFEPMTNTFRNVLQESVEDVYTTFLQRVSEGRNISIEEADAMAQGRVWSGVDAKRLGLVDELGGLDDAITEAASMVGLDSYGIKNYPKYKSSLEQILEDFGGASLKVKTSFIEEEIGVEAYSILKEVKATLNQEGIQAKMHFTLKIK